MGLFARLFGPKEDEHAEVRPLWHAVIARARDPRWYAQLGVADSLPGRFDAITIVLGLVLLRMEQEESLRMRTARLTELFVTDMDGQLRESGVGDVVMGKRMGKLMAVVGGRISAWRDGLAASDPAVLAQAVDRNVTLIDGADAGAVADEMRRLAAALVAVPEARLLAGELPA